MKKAFYTVAMLLVFLLICSSCSHSKSEIPKDVIASVNGELILKSEIDPVFQQYKDTDITYEKIVEDTILEILVLQQAEQFNVSISDKELDEIILKYKEEQPDLYNDSVSVYGMDSLRKKLKDRNTFELIKNNYMNQLKIESSLIHDFRMQPEFDGYLDNVDDETIKTTLDKELRLFAFQQWMTDLKKQAEILYY